MPTNYQNSVVYKIVCNNASIHDMYIGSTSNFTQRKYAHKNTCNNPNRKSHNLKVYKCIRALGGWDAWSMIPILEYPCKSKMALQIKEREVMESYNATLNCNSAYTTQEETIAKKKILKKKWDDANPNYMKKYRIDNSGKLKKFASEKIICECGSKIRRGDIAQHRKTTKHFKLMEAVVNQI